MTHPHSLHSQPVKRRIGRMARWQRRSTYWLLGLCAASGLLWFLGMDVLSLPPPRLRLLWVLHGVTGMIALMAIGAGVPQHALLAWRAHRNRNAGAWLGTALAAASLTALCLLYGLDDWRDISHWSHLAVGLLAGIAFPWHIWRGRRL